MALRITGSVIGEPITSSSTSATGMWTSQEVAALQKDGIWQIAPTFTLTPSASNVNEGASITITLTTTGIPNGAVVPYVITGANVNVNDSANGTITGNFVIQNNSNTISFSANADLTLEGAETLTITAGTASANVTINDTSDGADAQFSYTTLLLHGDGTNNSQNNTFLDSSTNNFTVTRNGNSTQGTFTPYGANWSNYFDGTGDYLTVPISTNATSDLTFECWFYATGYGSLDYGTIIGAGAGAGIFSLQLYNASNPNRILGYVGSTSGVGNLSPILSQPVLNRWIHLAVVRSGSTFTMYENGVSVATATNSNSMNFATATQLGAAGSSYTFQGYISNLRLFIGTAVYTSNFTPSTTPLTAISGTSLLTCQSNRFIDNSTNNFAITRNGDVSVQRFSPFSPTSAYSPSIYGGSAYFDGTGDYLSVADNVALQFDTGNFTIEMWVYLNTVSGVHGFLSKGLNSVGWSIVQSGTTLYFEYGATNITSSTTLVANKWTHIAVVRSGTSTNQTVIYVDGVSAGTGTVSTNFNDTNALIIGEYRQAGYTINAYVTDVRLVKGTAVYTSAFTPPTARLTAISGTSLLCNFTNAGIIDNAMMNNLETVGNAKISTTQSKFGGSSMSFDGTGDYLTSLNSSNFDFGAGDFTIEFWLYLNVTTDQNIIAKWWTGGQQWVFQFRQAGQDSIANQHWRFYANNGSTAATDFTETSTTSVSSVTWYHIALTRNGSSYKLFRNGTQVGSTYTNAAAITATTDPLTIGQFNNSSSEYLNGYVDDLRITKGYARYTSAFTPPTLAHGDK